MEFGKNKTDFIGSYTNTQFRTKVTQNSPVNNNDTIYKTPDISQ